MRPISEWRALLAEGRLDRRLLSLYGADALDGQRRRYTDAVNAFAARYGEDREAEIYSVSGRSELSGNHTDHNRGRVIAASVDLDILAVASPVEDGLIRLKSEGFDEDVVDPAHFCEPNPERFGRSDALIAGVVRGFADRGYATGGFDAYTTSNVPGGSGLSSSAAFEDMIGTILNHLYNGGRISFVEISCIAQYAENVFFGKPCGLMDQIACAAGGIVAIDFADPKAPVVEKLELDLTALGYRLCIINTGGNHADLTEDYAAVPAEMKAVAAALGKDVLREVDEGELLAAIPRLRESLGDRAILRALHFVEENRRVLAQREALEKGDLEGFFDGVLASGRSSFCYLQNVYTTKNVTEQGLSLALCLAERTLSGERAAWRVHGGGFAGTVQAFVPLSQVEELRRVMDGAFGEGSCKVLSIRPAGAIRVFDEE
ncbi:MAG: galactokinase [Clostridia bacterium]|nr:galactokinase [Clostridia bacterium]